ncbi:DEAD/DEAH box helicase [Bacillus sp. Marseille-P3661]|uniref:DEAD/DEAH box helicase n=1 Tax=Bacillus sp. Marseille-P3661 TaxID=1936234 RepID=UPI000C8494B4|nr:SNF2-related protein [Bacillus sp. Marseille-P3661]
MHVDIEFDHTWQEDFLEKVESDGPWANWELYKLAYEIEEHMVIPEFEGLIAPKHLPHLTPLAHQLEAAQTVLEQMNGKAILADEVGLGKTIEAGLILKEYMIRGLVKKVLILVPASLVSQWETELNQKFFIPAIGFRKSYVWEQCDIVISSIDTAKRNPHRDIIYNQNYDMVIIDEAHKLKNNKTKNYEFVQNLKKKFCLLLTATPVQNKVEEVFNLVSLLKPGHLGSQSNFSKAFSAKDRKVENNEYLKELINKVMIRNRRGDTDIEWTKRHVKTVPITLSKEEQDLYDAVLALKHNNYLNKSQFSLITLQKEVCSSREAAFFTLNNMLKKELVSSAVQQVVQQLVEKINLITKNSKAEKALEIIKNVNDKVIIFTEYRATQLYLQWFLKQHGITSVPFRGGFKRGKKDWMKELFKNNVQVLIATEAGGEGINLQFCNHIINYDLPWNPMRIEQRIGRIHRLGQEKDVMIYNFATKGTVEEYILQLLYEKINLFERVIGELDEILTSLDIMNIENQIEDILLNSDSDGEVKIKMDNLSSIINFHSTLSREEAQNAAARYS